VQRVTETGLLSGDRHFEWNRFEGSILRAARGLADLGIVAGDAVALLLRNDPAFLEASHAAMRLGAYAVPINWHFRPNEVGYVLRDCAARVLIVHADLLPAVAPAIPSGVAVLQVETPGEIRRAYGVSDTKAAIIPDAPDWNRWLEAQEPATAPPLPLGESMIYTSGTTGAPKGVRRLCPTETQAAAMEKLRQLIYGMVPGMRSIVPGPLYHSAPNSFGLRASRLGGLLVLMPRFDAEEFLTLVERHRITHAFMVPTMFVRLLHLPEAVRRRYDVSSLRSIVHAAAPCPIEVKRRMIEWWGPVLIEFYGGTEVGPLTICSSEEWLQRPGTVGRVVPRAIIKAIADDGREAATGTPGELFMRVADYADFTYQNQPDERAAVERDGLITLGDVGYFDDAGYLYLCDRKRDMIISGGVNIYPAEIEAALLRLPEIADCAVFGIPDAEFGEAVVAVLQPVEGALLSTDSVRRQLEPHLAGYKMPRRIEISAALPREDSGKILKRVLRAPYWEGTGRRI
jgi:long-chain acyl-CoA synthetase